MRSLLFALALAIALAPPAGADRARSDTKSLTLKSALSAALARNPDLEIAAIDVDIATARVVSARGLAEDPVLDAAVTGSSSRVTPLEGAAFQALDNDTVSVQMGVTKPLVTGGSIALHWQNPFKRESQQLAGDTAIRTTETYTSLVRLEVTQPLLRGAGSDASRALQRSASARAKGASASHEATATRVAHDVMVAYWELAYAAAEVDIRMESAGLAREHLRIVRAQVDKGDRAQVDLAEVEIEVALREEEVAIAEATLDEKSFELQQLMGAELDARGRPLRASEEVEFDIELPSRADALTAATRNNPALRSLAFEQRARGIEVAAADDAVSPALDFRASADVFGQDNQPSVAPQDMIGYESHAFEASLVFTMPLGRRDAKGKLAEARAQRLRVERQYDAARRQIQVDTARAYNRVVLAAKRMDVLRTATDKAVRAMKLDKRRYELGAITSFDVLRKQQELAEARLRQRRARVDHATAVVDLLALTGTLLDVLGINLA